MTALPAVGQVVMPGPGALRGERRPGRPPLRLDARPIAPCPRAPTLGRDRLRRGRAQRRSGGARLCHERRRSRPTPTSSPAGPKRRGEAPSGSGGGPDRHPGPRSGGLPPRRPPGDRRVGDAWALRRNPARPCSPPPRPPAQVTIALDAAQQSRSRSATRSPSPFRTARTPPGWSRRWAPSPPPASGRRVAPTITVLVTPTDPAATGTIDQAPVEVTITTGSAERPGRAGRRPAGPRGRRLRRGGGLAPTASTTSWRSPRALRRRRRPGPGHRHRASPPASRSWSRRYDRRPSCGTRPRPSPATASSSAAAAGARSRRR